MRCRMLCTAVGNFSAVAAALNVQCQREGPQSAKMLYTPDNGTLEKGNNVTTDLKTSANPPPYQGGYGGSAVASSSRQVVGKPQNRPDIGVPTGSFNTVCIQNRFQDITGTFYIDPKIRALEYTNRRKRRKQKPTPDAIFRSRRGKIALDLGTTGYLVEVPTASVVVSTKSGNISLNLISSASTKPRFDLEATTRSGDIVLFVPHTFSGAIQLQTRTGDINFLPGIAAAPEMRVIKSTDTEHLVFFGGQGPTQGVEDFCRLTTRSGNITVGQRGKDKYVKTPGVWERLVGVLRPS
ncbi:hypothetical protein C8J57DRAFT_1297898 [Mycena rebaudengoi]|nr:hypothetical protein C8J57DRAFT_1297898 [Mycena rebaudengoi]